MRPSVLYGTVCLFLLFPIAGVGQDFKRPDTPEPLHLAPPPSDRFPANWYPRVGDGTDVVPAPVTDHPYTAVAGELAPGSDSLLQPQRAGFQARDRFGRTRSEAESGGYSAGGETVRTKAVLVSDPVSHCDFQWTEPMTATVMPSEMRVAVVTCRPQTLRYKEMDIAKLVIDSLPDGTTRNGSTTSQVEHPAPVRVNGLLMQRLRVINGVTEANGEVKRTITETWYSPELKEIVRLGSEQDGFTGLCQIQLTDPDPKLFYPPEGFRIEVKLDGRGEAQTKK